MLITQPQITQTHLRQCPFKFIWQTTALCWLIPGVTFVDGTLVHLLRVNCGHNFSWKTPKQCERNGLCLLSSQQITSKDSCLPPMPCSSFSALQSNPSHYSHPASLLLRLAEQRFIQYDSMFPPLHCSRQSVGTVHAPFSLCFLPFSAYICLRAFVLVFTSHVLEFFSIFNAPPPFFFH